MFVWEVFFFVDFAPFSKGKCVLKSVVILRWFCHHEHPECLSLHLCELTMFLSFSRYHGIQPSFQQIWLKSTLGQIHVSVEVFSYLHVCLDNRCLVFYIVPFKNRLRQWLSTEMLLSYVSYPDGVQLKSQYSFNGSISDWTTTIETSFAVYVAFPGLLYHD